MFRHSQRLLDMEKKINELGEKVRLLTEAVADTNERCVALEAEHTMSQESLQAIDQIVKSLSKRIDWEAEQVHLTVAALLEQIRQLVPNSRDS